MRRAPPSRSFGWARHSLVCMLVMAFSSSGCSDAPGSGACVASEGCTPNVLLILVDDLRPELGAYGKEYAVTPNIDRLASEGVRFDQAYVQVPVCGASRASLLTGLRPNRNRFTTFLSRIDRDAPDATTLARLFAGAGYETISNGKVSHDFDDRASDWTRPPWRSHPDVDGNKIYVDPENRARFEATGVGPAWERLTVPDDAYPTGQVASRTISDLEGLAETGEPFFLAAGFWKPHLPFNAPDRYWHSYDDVPLGVMFASPWAEGAPDVAFHASPELRGQYEDIPAGDFPPELANTLARGYMASVSYTDAQIGRVLAALDRLRLSDRTIVVLVGDNGFQLGEHRMWTKHSNFDASLHVPLIIRAPGHRRGAVAEGIVELLDVYPTLAELAGLEPPRVVDGESLVGLLAEPDGAAKGFALSQYHALISFDPGPWLGRSIRTGPWLYTEWSEEGPAIHARMLYDHESDPGETASVVDTVDPAVVADLSNRLREVAGP